MTYPTILPWWARVLEEVSHERGRQENRWGQQNHPDGTGPALVLEDLPVWSEQDPYALARNIEDWAKKRTDSAAAEKRLTYEQILTEEWAEAIASAPDSPELRKELIQVAAVAVAWVEAYDRRVAAAAAEASS